MGSQQVLQDVRTALKNIYIFYTMVNFFRRGLKSNNATGSAPKTSNTAGNATKQSNGRKTNTPAATPKRNNGRKTNTPAATPKRNNQNVTVLGSGTRVRNVTNTVKAVGARAVALGGAAYKMYLEMPTAELLAIAAKCLVVILIVSYFLGQGTSPQIRLLKANIKNAERALVQKRKNGMNIYRAYMKKGNVNKAANYMRQLNEKHAPNFEKIESMKDELADLRRQIVQVAPPSLAKTLQDTLNAVTPVATTYLAIQAQIADIQTKGIIAQTAQQKALTDAELVSLQVAQAKQELLLQQKVQSKVGPIVGGVKALSGGVKSLASLSENMGTLRTAGQFVRSTGAQGLAYGVSAAGAIGRLRGRRAGRT